MLTALLSYLAGLLTVLAPCVLPLLPVILGGSLDANDRDRRRPYIIAASLVASLIVFTVLLKASTILIGVDPRVWSIGAGVLVIILGFFMLFPNLWAQLIGRLGIEHRSQSLLGKAFRTENRTWSAVLTGAALGPVFSSCSPTYVWVIATVLPANSVTGVIYLVIYCLGVATALLAVALLGRRLLGKIKWASNPKGWFQRAIAILFILVGIFVATGWDKKVQTYLVEKDFLNLIELEQKLVPDAGSSSSRSDASVTKANTAPEFQGIQNWINSDPLTLAELKGKVVLVDFWTYSCINCVRTQPYLNAWHDKYEDDGLVTVGMHAPEFSFEKVPENVERAIKDADIKYPVAMDNDFKTWNAYHNQYWPAKYLIDKNGTIRYTHFGEGEYEETEKTIQDLLKESGKTVNASIEAKKDTGSSQYGQTPETYLGYERAESFVNNDEFIINKPVSYTLNKNLNRDEWSLGGRWQVNDESSQAMVDGAKLQLNFSAKEVYLVMSGPPGALVDVSVKGMSEPGGLDVNSNKQVKLDGARLYKLVDTKKFVQNKQLTLTFPAGVTINALTFGG